MDVVDARRHRTKRPSWVAWRAVVLPVLALTVLGSAFVVAPETAFAGTGPSASASTFTPPPAVRARYRRCPSGFRLVYRGSRIGCYRRGAKLRKPRCAAGFHHPPAHFSCERDRPPAPQPPPLNTTNPPAAATQYWSTGIYGGNALADEGYGTCVYFDAWGLLRVTAGPPTVYAHDDHPGALDAAYVRLRRYLVRDDGLPLASGDYTAFATATDTTPATFPAGDEGFDYTPIEGHSALLDIRIEWWSASAMTGATAHRVSLYRYYRGRIGPVGPMGSCAITPIGV